MKKLAVWASQNLVWSRSLLIVSKILLFGCALFLGIWLFALDVILPPVLMKIGFVGMAIALIFYPMRGSTHPIWKNSFLKRKLMHGLLNGSFFLIVVQAFNSDANLVWNEKLDSRRAVFTIYKAAPSNESALVEEPTTTFSKKWSQKELRVSLRRNFKTLVGEIKHHARLHEIDRVGQVLLTILVLFISLYLIGLVAVLSCSLSCDGMETAAIFVLFGGLAGIVYLDVIVIRAIFKQKERPLYKPE